MAFHRGPKIVTDELVLYLDAANQKSYPGTGTTWVDLSGNGNDGTLINEPTFDSDNAGSIVFDGIDDYIDVNYNDFNLQGYTISFWLYINTSYTTYTIFNTYWNTPRVAFDVIEGDLRFNIRGSNGSTIPNLYARSSDTSFYIEKNVFYYITGVKDDDIIQLYINGIPASNPVSGATNVNATSARDTIGLGAKGGYMIDYQVDGFSGLISKFKIHNRALTASEIQQNYLATKSRFGL